VCIDNPGNPTGAHLAGDDLRTLVASVPDGVTVVLDEAYHHFAAGHDGYATAAELGLSHPRLLVMRTFSKAYGLAGLRVGYVVGPAELVGPVDQWRSRFNVAAPSQAAARAALADTDHLQATIDGTIAGRDRMQAWLADHGVPHTPSLGNFVTIELDRPAAEVVEAFAEREVGVRPLAPYGMDRQIRVSVGTSDEVDAFLDAAGQVLAP
jgi:histidinol-phosphate aminotransferase